MQRNFLKIKCKRIILEINTFSSIEMLCLYGHVWEFHFMLYSIFSLFASLRKCLNSNKPVISYCKDLNYALKEEQDIMYEISLV